MDSQKNQKKRPALGIEPSARTDGAAPCRVPVRALLLQDHIVYMHTHVAAHAEGGRGRRCQEHSLSMADMVAKPIKLTEQFMKNMISPKGATSATSQAKSESQN
ncbi:hypothetical protein MSG28_010807 [Choristoneura fumiferana]|uniref:Uncharacterized protein n=1 Tax=Choristoneura fumiferana TaxID=7141 RepID=A0ACC0KPV6_CHOFU|nr:hypothetical protein MSG28_010807 [Choristoneura fumiferana]